MTFTVWKKKIYIYIYIYIYTHSHIYMHTYSGENNYLIPCWFCTFAHWQRNDQSIILMVGLFEQWKTGKIQKSAFQKSYKLICILMSQISIWSPINQQDFWLPGVFYTAIRSTLLKGQDQRAVQGCQGQDCRPTQGWNGLQDHRQAAWWEGDNSWCDYLQMEETQNNYQSPSVLGLHARSHLVEFQWSWERWGISPELHGRILSMISRQLGP